MGLVQVTYVAAIIAFLLCGLVSLAMAIMFKGLSVLTVRLWRQYCRLAAIDALPNIKTTTRLDVLSGWSLRAEASQEQIRARARMPSYAASWSHKLRHRASPAACSHLEPGHQAKSQSWLGSLSTAPTCARPYYALRLRALHAS